MGRHNGSGLDFARGMDKRYLAHLLNTFELFSESIVSVTLGACVATIANISLAVARPGLFVVTNGSENGTAVTSGVGGMGPDATLLALTNLISVSAGSSEGGPATVQTLVAGILGSVQLVAQEEAASNSTDGVALTLLVVFLALLSRMWRVGGIIVFQSLMIHFANLYTLFVLAGVSGSNSALPVAVTVAFTILAVLMAVVQSIQRGSEPGSKFCKLVMCGEVRPGTMSAFIIQHYEQGNVILIVSCVALTTFNVFICNVYLLFSNNQLLGQFAIFLGPSVAVLNRGIVLLKKAYWVYAVARSYYCAERVAKSIGYFAPLFYNMGSTSQLLRLQNYDKSDKSCWSGCMPCCGKPSAVQQQRMRAELKNKALEDSSPEALPDEEMIQRSRDLVVFMQQLLAVHVDESESHFLIRLKELHVEKDHHDMLKQFPGAVERLRKITRASFRRASVKVDTAPTRQPEQRISRGVPQEEEPDVQTVVLPPDTMVIDLRDANASDVKDDSDV